MIRKIILIVLVCLLIFGSALMTMADKQTKSPRMERTFKIPGNGPGYDLLRTLADDFAIAADKNLIDQFMRATDKWIDMAKKAKENGDIDAKFFKRYKRLAIVSKLLVVPDKQGILNDLIVKEINKFGVGPLDKNFKYHGLGSVAAKLTEEILDLKKYLDRKSAK